MKLGLLFTVLSVYLASPALGEQTATSRKPNVIMIMADDLGYRDLGCYGHPSIKTPVLDRLAEGGIRLTRFHAGSSVCTPSRMALLTGAYPVRLGWTQGVIGYLMGSRDGMSGDALTIAEVFRAEGYATGISGKWHIGHNPESRPDNQGFDSTYFNPMSNNQLDEIWRAGEIVVKPADNRRYTELFTKEALRFIRENEKHPFFLYLPHTAPHFPVEAHPDWKGKSDFGEYGDVVEEMDFRTGELLELLDELELTEDTIVIFMSDNGPQKGEAASALPLRGQKWSPLEGGTRVPAIVSWPGTIPAGQTSDALISAIDLLPTLSRAAGIDLEKHTEGKPQIDGLDVFETLTGGTEKHPRDELLHWHGKHAEPQAFTQGDWKLFFDRRNVFQGLGSEGGSPEQLARAEDLKAGENLAEDAPMLFNIRDDIDETNDLSLEFPEKVKALQTRAKSIIEELASSDRLEIVKPN